MTDDEDEDEVEQTEFEFSELSESAKAHAIQRNAEPEYGWWEDTMEHYKQDPDLKAKGFDIDDINFSGFGSQGDGACWKGRVDMHKFVTHYMTKPEDAAKLAIWQALYMNDDLQTYMRIATNSRYSHSRTMYVQGYGSTYFVGNTVIGPQCSDIFAGANAQTLYEAVGGDEEHNKRYDWALEEAMGLADKIYKDLEDEHDGYFEEEAFADTADANDWKFDEDGVLL